LQRLQSRAHHLNMNYTNNRNNRCRVSFSTKSNIKQSKAFDNDTKRNNITAVAAAASTSTRKNIVTTRDKSCIQTILDSLDGYYYNDDERVQVVKEPLQSPPIQQIKPSSLRLNSHSKIPKEIIKKESPSPPPTVQQTPKHSNSKMKKGVPRRRHSLPDNAKLQDSDKLNQLVNTAARNQRPAVETPPQSSTAAQPIKQTRRRRHTLSGNTAERPDISCIQSFIRQSNIHEEDYYHHPPKNKQVVKTHSHEFERVDTNQTHEEYERVETDHNQSASSNNNNNQEKSQVKRIIIERRRRHSMPDNMRAPNPSDLLMSLPLPANHHGKGFDKQRGSTVKNHHTSSTPPSKEEKYTDENEEKYSYKAGQSLQDATSHSLQFTSKTQATKLLSQLPINTPLFVKRTSNQQWQAQWSYCVLAKHIYNEDKLISVEVSLTDIQEGGKDKKRVRTKVIEERYFERWLMMVNYKTVLVQESTATPTTSLPADCDVDDQTDMATRGSESNQMNDRPPRLIFQGNEEDVNSSIYSSSSSSSSSGWGASSSNDFYSVISSTESFSSSYSSSLYSSSSSYLYDAGNAGHDIPERYLNFNSPIPLPNDDDVSTTSAISSCCSSGASDQVLIASKSARLLRASF